MVDTGRSYEERIKLLQQELATERAEKNRLALLYSPQSNTADPGSSRTTPPRPTAPRPSPMEPYNDLSEFKDHLGRHLPDSQQPIITLKVEPAKPEFYYGDDAVISARSRM
jgi:hypothetical protein